MLKSKTFLAIDFGAGSLKAAEFEPSEDGGLRLLRFGVRPMGLAGSQDVARESAIKKVLPELLAEGGYQSSFANVCAPGFQVFSKFVKLPPVDSSKVTQIIQYEAQQNVPFPLTETAWDYQILGTSPTGELEVLLIAIKSEIVEKQILSAGEASKLRIQTVDCSVGALANAFRFNYPDQEGCSLVIDVGAKTSNVLLFEANKYYARSVNVGANAITQEFAAEAKLRFDDAEKFKIVEGFVSLGGAYEEPDNPKVAAVSKVARNVLTRLHLQVNQTVQFYRTQQGGGAPVRVMLCGGGSIMPYAAQFFQEKLNLPVEFFNPFRNVQIGSGVVVEDLEKVAQSFGELVGVALRSVAQCPVELNLVPKASLVRQEFNTKKPYLLASAFALALGVGAVGMFSQQSANAFREGSEKISEKLNPLETVKTSLQAEESKLSRLNEEATQLGTWLEDRTYWAEVFVELRRVLLETERSARVKLGVDVGVWIDTLLSTEPTVQAAAADEDSPKPMMIMDPILARRYGLVPQKAPDTEAPDSAPTGTPSAKKGGVNTNEIGTINLTIRAVNLKAKANGDLAYEVERNMKASPLFDDKETQLSGTLDQVEDSTPSFTFPLKVKLKRPIKL